MKVMIALTLALAVLSGSAMAGPSKWTDIFTFPFLDVPVQLMFGIACPSMKACFIAGGNTNTAFGVYKTGPLPANFSNVTKCPIASPVPSLILMSVAFEDETHGVTGGLGIGVGGTYYTTNGMNFTESLDFGLIDTQAVYSMGNDRFAFVGQ